MKRLLIFYFLLCSMHIFSAGIFNDLFLKEGLYYEANSTTPYTGVKEIYNHGYRVYTIENGELKNLKIYDSPKKKYIEKDIIYKNGVEFEQTFYGDKQKFISGHYIIEGNLRHKKHFNKSGTVTYDAFEDLNGKRVGTWYYYYDDGTLKEVGTIDSQTNRYTKKRFSEKGILVYEDDSDKTINYDEKGRISTYQTKPDASGGYTVKTYNEEGNVVSTIVWKDSIHTRYIGESNELYNGELREYGEGFFPKLKSVGTYKDGLLEGEYKEYSNGDKSEESFYKQGKKIGESKKYGYQSRIEEFYVDNKLEGIFKHYSYHPVKKKWFLVNETEYKNGMKNGKAIHHNDGGVLTTIINYKDNKKDGEYTSFYYSGKIKSIEIYQNDKHEGISVNYYENGNVKSDVNYINDKREGLENLYAEEGYLKQQINYEDNKRQGISYIFDKDGNAIQYVIYTGQTGYGEKVE